MVKEERVPSPPATEDIVTRAEGSELNQLRLKKVKESRRKRRDIRRLKNPNDDTNTVKPQEKQEKSSEISLSFPSSSSSSSSEYDASDLKCDEKMLRYTPHGFISIVGKSREMEDFVTIELGFIKEYDFFAVYDGHGGSFVAKECQGRLHHVVAKEVGGCEDEKVNWEKVMVGSFEKIDKEVKCGGEKMKTIGSTAVVAVVGKDELVVANCGDSRAVICRGGVAAALSSDHKPDRADELERVEAAGGRVINWNGYRILGVLATSRSVGDEYMKPFVISEPEITICQRTKTDEFIILASDGLWDAVSNEVACQIVRKCLYGRIGKNKGEEINRATEAAALLSELAMARGSKDNISVIIVELRKSR